MAATPNAGVNSWAIFALVGALFFGPLGILGGHIALHQIQRTGQRGSGMATAGLILGYLSVVVLFGALMVIGVLVSGGW